MSTITSGEFSEFIPQTGAYDSSNDVLHVPIDQLYRERFAVGLTGTTSYNNVDYSVEVSDVNSEIVGGRFLIDMKFTDSIPPKLRDGASLRLRIMLSGTHQALLLPVGGFYKDTRGEWILKLNGNRAVKQQIKLGKRNTENFEVIEGLQIGDSVITSSYENFLELGDVVELSELEEAIE